MNALRILGYLRDGRPVYPIAGGDDVLIDNGAESDFSIAADAAGTALVQLFKLAYSADGDRTHVTADSSGLLVNLGTNNDITLTSGTLTAVSGTVTTTVAGTPTVSVSALPTGTSRIGYTGISSDGTAIVDILSLTSGTALAVGIYDNTGAQLPFAAPAVLSATPTLGTAAYSSATAMGTAVMSFASATVQSSGTGHVLKAMCVDDADQGMNINLWLFQTTVTHPGQGSAFALSDADLDDCVGVIAFDSWYDAVNGRISIEALAPPLPYNTSGSTTLYGIPVTNGTGTFGTASLEFRLHVVKD